MRNPGTIAAMAVFAMLASPASALERNRQICLSAPPAVSIPACTRELASNIAHPQSRPRVLTARARAFLLTGEFDKALLDARQAVRAAPHNHRAWAILGAVHHRLGNHARAWRAHLKAMALDPDFETVCEYG